MLSNLETLITSIKLETFEKRITENQQFSQQQLSSIQENLNNNDSYSFRKKGNEEQHKANGKALRRIEEADGFLRDALASGFQMIYPLRKEKFLKVLTFSNIGKN